jgi:hypothetical protein
VSDALALDLRAATSAYDRVVDLMKTVMVYKTGIEALDLTPAQAFGTTFDPFENLPGLRQALTTARANAAVWNELGNRLWMGQFMSAHEMSGHLSSAAADTRKIVDAAKTAKRELTQTEIDAIAKRLQDIQRVLDGQRSKMSQARTDTSAFVGVVVGDYGKLTNSSERLDGAVKWIDEWIVRVGTQYLRPDQSGILKMIAEMGAAARKKIIAGRDAVGALVGASEKAQVALPGIVSAWDTVDGKFKAVIRSLQTAAQAAKTAGDVPIMLDVASARWMDYLKYIGTTV